MKHFSLRVLEFFRNHDVVMYALPARTIGKKQPYDTGIFAPSNFMPTGP